MAVTREQLLGEVEDLLRSVPTPAAFCGPGTDAVPWLGRALAAVGRWSLPYSVYADAAARQIESRVLPRVAEGLACVATLLNQARADLRMELGQISTVLSQGRVFDYFDELRKVIETARSEVFFVDPYLDAEFVSRYLPCVPAGVSIRLLGNKYMPALLPAVDLFAKQSGRSVQVRSLSGGLHDRYVFLDQAACYLSGASFKDGAKNAPTVLTQINDGFAAMWTTYEQQWQQAKVERP